MLSLCTYSFLFLQKCNHKCSILYYLPFSWNTMWLSLFVNNDPFRILYSLVVRFLLVTYITISTLTFSCFQYSAVKNYASVIVISSSTASVPSWLVNGLGKSNRFWCLQSLSLWLIKKQANMYYHHSQCLERRKHCCSLKGAFMCVCMLCVCVCVQSYICIHKISYLSLFFHYSLGKNGWGDTILSPCPVTI